MKNISNTFFVDFQRLFFFLISVFGFTGLWNNLTHLQAFLRLIKVEPTTCYFCIPGPKGVRNISRLSFTYIFDRNPESFVSTLIIPIIAVSLIAISSYFLPPESGERMGVLITVFLSFAVLFNIISEMLPTSEKLTYVGT